MRRPASEVLPTIRALRAAGHGYKEIGEAVGLSRSRIHFICQRYGLPNHRGELPRTIWPEFPGVVALAKVAQVRAYWERVA